MILEDSIWKTLFLYNLYLKSMPHKFVFNLAKRSSIEKRTLDPRKIMMIYDYILRLGNKMWLYKKAILDDDCNDNDNTPFQLLRLLISLALFINENNQDHYYSFLCWIAKNEQFIMDQYQNLKTRYCQQDFEDFLEKYFSQNIKLTTYFSDMWNYVKCDIS